MEVLSLIIEIVLCVLALALIVLVLCQKSDRNGMSALTGGGEAIFGKGKKKGIEAKRIVTDHKGDTVQPFAVNDENRVVICTVD